MFSARARRRALLVALVSLTSAGLVAASARADADPASDILYSQSVFYSFDRLPSDPARKRLDDVVAKVTKDGYPIRVALIATPADLGGVGALWAKPKQYARFLGLELTFFYRGNLLVVMPAGVGFSEKGKSVPAAEATLRPVRVLSGEDGLADAAVDAIARLATAAGHPISVPPKGASSDGSSGRSRLIIVIGAAILAPLIAGAYLLLRREKPS